MFKARICLAGLTLAVAASAAQAAVSFTPAVTSDYDYRGLSQSATRTALQLGADYNQGAFHANTKVSTMQFGPSFRGNMEWDAQADYTYGSGETYKVQIGVLARTFPSNSGYNITEPFVTVSKDWLSVSAHYTNDFRLAGKAWYTEANGSYPVGQTGYKVAGHVGHSKGDAWNGSLAGISTYTDWSLGVSKTVFGKVDASVKYVTSDARELTNGQSLATFGYRNVFETRDRVILTLSTTLDWTSK